MEADGGGGRSDIKNTILFLYTNTCLNVNVYCDLPNKVFHRKVFRNTYCVHFHLVDGFMLSLDCVRKLKKCEFAWEFRTKPNKKLQQDIGEVHYTQ